MTSKEQHLADTLRSVGVTLITASTAFQCWTSAGVKLTAERSIHEAQVAVNEAQGQLQLYWMDEAERLRGMAK